MTYLEPEPDRKKEKKTPTLEELKTKAEKAADEWFAKHAADLKVLVHKRLEKSFEEIFLAALGLKKGWGSREWEVDRMNGRSSVISGELDARARDRVSSTTTGTSSPSRSQRACSRSGHHE